MAKDKKSFVLYADLLKSVDHLTDEELGRLFKHMLEYVNDLNPVLDDRLLLTAWKPIERSLKEDLKKWEEIRTKRAKAGAKGGKAKQANAKFDLLNNVITYFMNQYIKRYLYCLIYLSVILDSLFCF